MCALAELHHADAFRRRAAQQQITAKRWVRRSKRRRRSASEERLKFKENFENLFWKENIMSFKSCFFFVAFKKMNFTGIVYFTATWCGPCQKLKPVLAHLRSMYPLLDIDVVDIDKDPRKLAEVYSIAAVPTVLFMINGKVVERIQGAQTAKIQEAARRLVARIEKSQNDDEIDQESRERVLPVSKNATVHIA